MVNARCWKDEMIRDRVLHSVLAGFLASSVPLFGCDVAAQAGVITLAPHRAIYDLKLRSASGRRPIDAVRGRILYDFAGSSCEGYALQFRQVSEIESGEGKVSLSDLRATTWEDGQGKSFRFASQNFVDGRPVDVADGKADRKPTGIGVSLTKPETKALELDKDVLFPSEHMRRIIEAAQGGKSLLELPVFDGSETGQKVFNTLTVIGHEIDKQKTVDDAVAKVPEMANMKRWPVTISYFDRATTGGEQTPVYAIGFELFENGISRALSLDYGDFIVAGEMSQLELKTAPDCK
jgi:hypothetical protein